MNKNKSQSGSLHLIIVIVLTVALLGALGFIFWQNFISKSSLISSDNSNVQTKESDDTATDSAKKSKEIEYKTYTTSKYNMSFQYPSDWTLSVKDTSTDDPVYGFHYSLNVDIANSDGDKVATFRTGLNGLGGTCGGATLPRYSVLDAEKTGLKAVTLNKSGVDTLVVPTVSYLMVEYDDDTYGVHYGLTEQYVELADGQGCMFYFTVDPDIDGLYTIAFGNDFIKGIKFSSLYQAKEYMKSDEYAQIKKMILSLKY